MKLNSGCYQIDIAHVQLNNKNIARTKRKRDKNPIFLANHKQFIFLTSVAWNYHLDEKKESY